MVEKNRTYQIVINIIFVIWILAIILPFLLIIGSSLTSESALLKDGYRFVPKEWDFTSYKYLFFGSNSVFNAYITTIIVTVIGTLINLTLTTLFAYPLSRRDLPGRNFVSFFLFFTMIFNGGLISSYMLWSQTFQIKDTIWALIVPNLMMQAFYVIMMRTYFTSNIPDAIIEATRIDGGSEFTVLLKVVLPMSTPIMATVGLMVAVMYWNDWANGLYYINDDKYYSIQLLLYRMMKNVENMKKALASGATLSNIPTTSLQMAVGVLGSLPMLIAYPFFQKYFIKGITVGAVKG